MSIQQIHVEEGDELHVTYVVHDGRLVSTYIAVNGVPVDVPEDAGLIVAPPAKLRVVR